MKAARCAPTLCGGKPNDLAAGTASYRLNFLAARLDGTENPTKRPPIRRMSAKKLGIGAKAAQQVAIRIAAMIRRLVSGSVEHP